MESWLNSNSYLNQAILLISAVLKYILGLFMLPALFYAHILLCTPHVLLASI